MEPKAAHKRELKFTKDEVVNMALYYLGVPENSRHNAHLKCYLILGNTKLSGVKIELKYHAGVGYYWYYMEFYEPKSSSFSEDGYTNNIFTALFDARLHKCPYCKHPMYSDGKLHNFKKCMPIVERLRIFFYRLKMGYPLFRTPETSNGILLLSEV